MGLRYRNLQRTPGFTESGGLVVDPDEPFPDRYFSEPTRCPYCNQAMSWKELSGHMMASHPKVLEAEKRWAKDTRRVWIRAAIPTTVAWFASFILILLSLLSSHVEIILAEIGVAYFVIMGTYFYARHATGTDFEEVRDLPHFCRTCDRAVPGRYLKDHIRQTHPEVARLQRMTDVYLLLTGLFVVILLAYTVSILFAMGARFPGTSGRGVAGLGMFGWVGLAYLWTRFVYSPRTKRARDQWERDHAGSLGVAPKSQ